jgi:tetratricopeptide (TPR) repeat protein
MRFSRYFTLALLSATSIGLLSSCAFLDKKDTAQPSNWFVSMFEKDGQSQAKEATLAYLNGNFEKTLEYTTEALKANPRNQQALLVGALAAEKLGRYNKARQYYEDLIVIDGDATSILGTDDSQPQKISSIAKKRLHALTISQTKLTIENKNGTKSFAVSPQAGKNLSKQAINKALSKKAPALAKKTNVDNLFSPEQQNVVSRFLILKELAEKDFITKQEFLSRRRANLGGLLPLTHQAPGVGIDQPVPSPDLIIERLDILKEGVSTRAITPREFSAERDVIIEALMSPNPRSRLKNKAPSKNILDAAKDLRRLEALYNLGLITDAERAAEKQAIEKYLGIHHDEPSATAAAANTITSANADNNTVSPAAVQVQVQVPSQIQVPASLQVPNQVQIPANISAPTALQISGNVEVATPNVVVSVPSAEQPTVAPATMPKEPAPAPVAAEPNPIEAAKTSPTLAPAAPQVTSPF